MMIYFNKLTHPIAQSINKTGITPCFKSRPQYDIDKFEKQSSVRNINMTISNPHTHSKSSGTVTFDITKPQKITLNQNHRKIYSNRVLTLDYNPERYSYLKDKHSKQPVKTFILIGEDSSCHETSYHFMSENLEKEYGYVNISNNFLDTELTQLFSAFGTIYEDYPEFGVIGPRITIEYLKNLDEENIGGIGNLADKMSVVHCLKHNIRPVIVSMADKNSHVAHYLRGKRFFPIEDDPHKYNYFMNIYGTADINEIVKNLIAENKDKGRISTKEWSMIPMYMPQDRIDEILDSLKDSQELLC